MAQTGNKKKMHAVALLLGLAVLASLLTYTVPAGSFDREFDKISNQTLVVPGSFRWVEQAPVAPWLLPEKLVETVSSAGTAKIISFILIIGGAFEIIMQSGAIAALFGWLLPRFQRRRQLLVPVFVCLFSVFGFTMGLSTASIVFVPIGITVARALGYDQITGMAMVMLGTNAGFAAGIFNPFSVGVAQMIAELPLYSGAWIRWLLLVFILPLTFVYIVVRAKKGSQVLAPHKKAESLWNTTNNKVADRFSLRKGLVLLLLASTLVVVTIGISRYGWSTRPIAAAFIVMAAIAGPVAGLGINKTCDTFIAGCKKMMGGAVVIAVAATVRSVLAEGQILDTIAYTLIGSVENLPAWAQLMGMFYANALLDPFITSGSAHAAVAMPIMVPMADVLGLSRQAAVFAFQLGDGLVNLISPISTTLTACLAVSGISYTKWVRYYLPLIGLYLLLGTGFVFLAIATGY